MMLWPTTPEKKLKRIQDNGTNVEILWTPGHTGTDGGNAAAHAVAAQAGGLVLILPDVLYFHSISSPTPWTKIHI